MNDLPRFGSNDDISDEEADALIEQLGLAMEDTAMVPPWLTRFAYESQRLVSIEGELAEISADSLLAPAGTRSTGGLRTIDFRVEGISIRLEIEGLDARGSVEPTDFTVRLVHRDAERLLDVNRRGFFSFDVPVGPFRILADLGERQVRTDWITLR